MLSDNVLSHLTHNLIMIQTALVNAPPVMGVIHKIDDEVIQVFGCH